MFIPDIKNLVTKMQYKSVNRVASKKYINDQESRIKKSAQHNVTLGAGVNGTVLTNMNAYINKCCGD